MFLCVEKQPRNRSYSLFRFSLTFAHTHMSCLPPFQIYKLRNAEIYTLCVCVCVCDFVCILSIHHSVVISVKIHDTSRYCLGICRIEFTASFPFFFKTTYVQERVRALSYGLTRFLKLFQSYASRLRGDTPMRYWAVFPRIIRHFGRS